jgi:iron complex outermembrane recepter protein
MSRSRLSAPMVVALIALLAGPLLAQSTGGSLTGVVNDSSGGLVAGATVTATGPGGAAKTAVTAADGSFTIDGLAPGAYAVTASLMGFRRVTRADVQITESVGARLEFTLEPLRTEEITVTAMLREQELGDVPFSVAAPTEEVLRERGVVDIEGVAANVGGFTVQNLGPGQSQIAMRGVSAGQIVRDQPGVKEQVGVYLDDSVVSLSLFTPDLDLFDVARVEVLRGPQGTLFGSGSLSGTVRYITGQPEKGTTRWFGELGGSTISNGNQGGSVKLGVNAPLGETAAARVVGYFNRVGGYVDAVQPGGGIDEDVNTGYKAGGRAALSFSSGEKLVVTPRITYQKVKMDGWNRVDIFNILANPFTTSRPAVTLGDLQQFAQLDETFTDEFLLGDLNINYNFGNTSLRSVTSFTHRDVLVIRDATTLTGSITGGSLGLPEPVYTLDSPLHDATEAKLFTQEVRLSGSRDKLNWVVGGFFSHTDRDYGQDLPTTGFTALTGIPTRGLQAPEDNLFFSRLGYKLDQFAAFGEGTYELSGDLSLTAGLRYYHFSEDKEQVFDGIFGNDNNGTSVVSQPGTTDASGVAPRVILSYKVSENARLNAQVSRGFRLGGINDPLNVPLCTPDDLATFGGRDSWQDEKAWDYEVGTNGSLPNGRGSFRLAGFYMDISDLQATVTAGSCSSRLIFNVPKARSRGFEADVDIVPSKNFDFSVSGSYTNSEMRSTVAPVAATGIIEGRRLPTVPKLQMAVAATYQWQVRPTALGYITGSFQHVGERFTQVNDLDLGVLDLLSFGANTIGGPLTQSTLRYDPTLPAYDILNARVGVKTGRWDIALYANNLTDERALLSFDRERGTRARLFNLVNQPRTIGISARFDY